MSEGTSRKIDFTRGRWGHAAAFDSTDRDAGTAKVHGWGGQGDGGIGAESLPRVDDVLLVAMDSGRIARFVVREIRYTTDPSDMWFATVEHDGTEKEAGE